MRKIITLAALATSMIAIPVVADAQPRGRACPPGLSTRNCIPPGQARRAFREGQRLPVNYRSYTAYTAIPVAVRTRYSLVPTHRYVYRGNVDVVDPTTRLVNRIIDIVD